jgi:hypothetical protein
MYTREEFARRRSEQKRIEGREMRLLAFVAVPLGIGQLVMIRLLEARLERSRAVAIEGAVFLAYMALVGALLWRMLRRLRVSLLSCPQCGVKLRGMSESVAAATGQCDSCGGQVIEVDSRDSR